MESTPNKYQLKETQSPEEILAEEICKACNCAIQYIESCQAQKQGSFQRLEELKNGFGDIVTTTNHEIPEFQNSNQQIK